MWVWNAFWCLSNARGVGFDGLLRLTVSDIAAYTALHEYDLARKLDFLVYIQRMDFAFMEYVNTQKREENMKQKLLQERNAGRKRR